MSYCFSIISAWISFIYQFLPPPFSLFPITPRIFINSPIQAKTGSENDDRSCFKVDSFNNPNLALKDFKNGLRSSDYRYCNASDGWL
jgi:hypothetical protein